MILQSGLREASYELSIASSLVKTASGTYNLYYSSSNAGTDFNIGVATASSPAGPFSKYSGNPVTGDGDSEEPSCGILRSGQIYCFTDDPLNQLATGTFRIFFTSDPAGLTGWSEQSPYTVSPIPAWIAGGHLGAIGQTQIAPNQSVMVSNGATSSDPQAARSIGFFDYTANYSVGR